MKIFRKGVKEDVKITGIDTGKLEEIKRGLHQDDPVSAIYTELSKLIDNIIHCRGTRQGKFQISSFIFRKLEEQYLKE